MLRAAPVKTPPNRGAIGLGRNECGGPIGPPHRNGRVSTGLPESANDPWNIGAGNPEVGKNPIVHSAEGRGRGHPGPPPAERFDNVGHGLISLS